MATTNVRTSGWDGGLNRRSLVEVTFSASYTAGGEALAASDAGLGSIEAVNVLSGVTNSGYVVRWDDAAGTLQLFEENATAGPLAEVAGATDVSTETILVEVLGRS